MYTILFLLLCSVANLSFGMHENVEWEAYINSQKAEEPLLTIFEEHDCKGEAIFKKLLSRKSESRFFITHTSSSSDDNSDLSPCSLDNVIQLLAENKIEKGIWRVQKPYTASEADLDEYESWLWSGRDMAMQSLTPQNGRRDRELRVRVYEAPGGLLLKDIAKKAFKNNRFNVVRVIAKRIDFTDFDFTRYRNNLKHARFTLMAGREDLSGIRRKFIKKDTKNSSKAKR